MKTLALILSLFYSTIVYGAVLTLDDYAASETSIYDHLNDNIDKIEAVLNSGLEGDNFDATFAVGSDQVGANAIGSTQMQDYSIGLLNMQTDAVDTRVIVDDSVTADDINSLVEFSDVFPENSDIYWSFQTGTPDWGFSQKWRARCYGEWMTGYRQDLAFHVIEDGVVGDCYMYFDADTGYIAFHNLANPQAQVDINGTLRVQGQAEFEGGIARNWTKLPVNDTTPDVYGGNNFYTANTGTGSPTLNPITYTDFDGGVAGQRILVRVMDIFTTFSSETTTSLWTQDTSADWGALSATEYGVIYEFQLVGSSDWYCLNRYGPFMQGTAGGGTPSSFPGASENWESGGKAGGSGWVASSTWTYDGSNQSAISKEDSHGGTYAAGLVTGSTIDRPLVTSSGTATITVYAKKYTGTPVLYIYDSTNGTSFTELTHITVPAAYTAIPYTWTMADTTEYIRFGCLGTGALWLDDITIE